jgi:uncharacterized protein DUF4258
MIKNNVIELLRLTNEQAERYVKDIARDSGGVILSRHALMRMDERGITRKQVLGCLSRFRIVEDPCRTPKGNWKLTIEAQSMDDFIRIPICLENQGNGNFIIVITVIKLNKN